VVSSRANNRAGLCGYTDFCALSALQSIPGTPGLVALAGFDIAALLRPVLIHPPHILPSSDLHHSQ